MRTCKCGECDQSMFYADGRLCKRCKSLQVLQRYHAKREQAGLQKGPTRIGRRKNPVIYRAAKAIGLLPHDFVRSFGEMTLKEIA